MIGSHLYTQALGRGQLVVYQVLGYSNEVGEGVHLVLKLALLIPLTTHLPPTTHVRNRKDEPSIDE